MIPPRADFPRTRAGLAVAAAVLAGAAAGCGGPGAFRDIDRRVDALIAESADAAGLDTRPATGDLDRGAATNRAWRERPDTMNPSAAELAFEARIDADADAVIGRLEGYTRTEGEVLTLDLERALAVASEGSRDIRFEEEEYVLSALRLLIERHRWGPRFFDDVSATIDANPTDGSYDTALRIVNELGVTQRLPYGGSVSASFLARATEDLHERVAGPSVQSAELLLSANVPLLRGAGRVARESRVQSERDLVYAARAFERFRREFLFRVARDYLDLVVQKRQISISERQVMSFENVEQQQVALEVAGRSTPFDADEARNETLDAIDSLNDARERFRLSKDRFKILLGLPVDRSIEIEDDNFGLPVPATDLETAVRAAMRHRLDLQTQRDRLDDRRRALEVARDQLLPDLTLGGSVSMPTDPARDRGGLGFEPDETEFTASVTFGLPLDREIERLGVRTSQISLMRAERDFDRFRDTVAADVRAAVRGIDSAAFSLRIQEQNVLIAGNRKASIDADPARANIRQRTDAINSLARAESSRDSARRNLELAILEYLLATGQLRVESNGNIDALEGMMVGADPAATSGGDADPNADAAAGEDPGTVGG